MAKITITDASIQGKLEAALKRKNPQFTTTPSELAVILKEYIALAGDKVEIEDVDKTFDDAIAAAEKIDIAALKTAGVASDTIGASNVAVAVANLAMQSSLDEKAKKEIHKKILEKLATGLDEKDADQKKQKDALLNEFNNIVPEPGKVATIGLDDVKTKVIARLTEAKMDPTRITVFETGFDEMVGHLKDDEKKAIAVPENKINAIADAVFELNLKKDDAKTAVDKDEAALGVAGVAAMLTQGITDAKVRDEAVKTIKDEFAKKFADKKDKDASGKLVDEAQKASEKYAAIPVKGVTFGKVASVGLGVGLVAWLVNAFKGKPVVDTNGNPELDESGNQKRESAPLWKKALLGILTAATLCFAGKVAVQGKEVGTALGEMKNPLTWVSRTAPSPTATAIGR